MRAKSIGLVMGPILFLLISFFFHADGLSKEGTSTLAIAVWIAFWWITEAIPISATALLPLVLFPITGVMSIKATSGAFANQMIFLFLGGFILAVAIEKTNLHKRIALTIIHQIGSNWNKVILGFMIATAFLSMWISNTATAVMMMPIGLAVISQINTEEEIKKKMGRSLMLAIAYGCSIGGIATIIGTPTNVIFVGIVEELYKETISFTDWMMLGLPFSLVMLAIGWLYLTKIVFPVTVEGIPGGKKAIQEQIKQLGKISYQERSVFIVFLIVALCWMSSSLILKKIIPGINDTIIAIAGALSLFLIPATKQKTTFFSGTKIVVACIVVFLIILKAVSFFLVFSEKPVPNFIHTAIVSLSIIGVTILFSSLAKNKGKLGIIDWKTAEKIPWGILLLFGGGLALAEGFKVSGLAKWIGSQLSLFEAFPIILLILAIITVVNFLTEITSNVATAAMLMPVLAALAFSIDIHPYLLMIAGTVAASCAFMLPVATPPNAVVFGSGLLTIPKMMKAGFWMNIISIVLATIFIYFILPLVWQIDINTFPELFK
ncbi:SLC13 family permease [Aquimarina algicola]|uniref:SLC13/DASS family transporter n=1 Tax=Aquimarina algicola TaxID=2589995 RepID=A0A504J2Y3_9FLAO|nr:SLC13 family permease [Aquimarina algicola]TPN85227.1 SLC13/DASS family transporter [Aquimarina algicola]